jgi:AraC-like DNA-binding protein
MADCADLRDNPRSTAMVDGGHQMERMDLLAASLGRHAKTDGMHPSAIPGVWLIRASSPTEPLHVLHAPAVCIVASGRKQVSLADLTYEYDAAKYLVVSVDLPIGGQVIEASEDTPYLCIRIDLDVETLAAIVMEQGRTAPADDAGHRGLFITDTTAALADAAIRLLSLLDTPADIGFLAPLALREIYYRLLNGPQGGAIRSIAAVDGRLQQVTRAICWIKRHYTEPFSIDAVASEARMSHSALHQHFKAVTSLSPLQYQKQLRLQEARRLMLARAMDAARAGYEVGYESPSQFTREYTRLFGAPPARDVARLRASASLLVEA